MSTEKERGMERMLNLLQKRRSIRRFTDEPIIEDHIVEILQSALLAPSSKSIRPWEFIVVNARATLTQLVQSRKPAMTFLGEAQAAIVVLADTSKNDVWVEDCAIAAVLMQLTAADLGLGSCWVQIRNRQSSEEGVDSDRYVRRLLDIPEGYAVEALIALGHPAEEKKPVSLDKLMYQKVHKESFGQAYFKPNR